MGDSVKWVWWRGTKLNRRTIDVLEEAERILGFKLVVTQGSYNTSVSASGGTHDGGGAFDIRARAPMTQKTRDKIVLTLRQIGAGPTWHRKPSEGAWPHHIHGIVPGDPDLSDAAKRQVTSYRNGRNGLANQRPDTGPDVPWITWEQYLASKAVEKPDVEEEDEVKHIYLVGSSRYRILAGDRWLPISSALAANYIKAGAKVVGVPFEDEEMFNKHLITEKG